MGKSEFEIIQEIFAPLASAAQGAFSLGDDAAQLDLAPYIVSKDLLVEGTHFPKTENFSAIAQRAIRTNLSDVAAKGAKPIGYFLGCVWPKSTKLQQIEAFAAGLLKDQKKFKIALYGGDTTVHKLSSGPLTVSITIFATPARGGMIMRHGAKAGDDFYVSGTLGDAKLGLLAEQKPQQLKTDDSGYFLERFWTPIPRLGLGGALAGVATSAIDVSDGLLADAGHLATQSKVGIQIDLDSIPLSVNLSAWLSGKRNRQSALLDAISFGDDYEIAFTAPKSMRRSVEMASNVTKTPVTRVGKVMSGDGVALIDPHGNAIGFDKSGFDHFG